MSVLWEVASCSVAETDGCFRGVYRFHHQGDLLFCMGVKLKSLLA